jgi:hypothetical protein
MKKKSSNERTDPGMVNAVKALKIDPGMKSIRSTKLAGSKAEKIAKKVYTHVIIKRAEIPITESLHLDRQPFRFEDALRFDGGKITRKPMAP